MLNKLFSHTAIYGLAPQIPKIATVLTFPIITQYLSKVDFGVYGIIIAVTTGFSVLGTLGLNIILSTTFYKSPQQYKWAWRQIYGFLSLWNIPVGLLLALVIFLFVPKEAESNTWYIILLNVAPVVFFGPTAILGSLYYQLKQKPIPIAIRSVIIGLLAVVLNIYFIAYMGLGYMGWFLSICISSLLNHGSYWLPLNTKLGITPIFNFKWRLLKQYLAIGIPTVPHTYSSYLVDSSDRVVMKLVKVSTGDIGLYNTAYIVGNIIQQIGMAAGKAATPMLFKAFRNNHEREARNYIFVLQVGFLVITFILCIWLKEFFVLLIKNKTLQSVYPIAIIIIMAYNYRPMYLGAVSKLFYREKTKSLLKISFIAGIANLVLNFMLIPIYGYKAAAVTTFLALMYMGYSGYFLKEFKEESSVAYFPLVWLFVTVGLTLFSYFAVEFNSTLKVFLSIISLTIGFFLIKRISSFENIAEPIAGI